MSDENIIDMTDNSLAIKMLKDITVILNAIEHNDFNYIETTLKELKEHIIEFEKIVYQNKTDGLYENTEELNTSYIPEWLKKYS
jgi:hypothetical protein